MERTVDTIITNIKQIVSEKKTLSPHEFAEAAAYLNVLIGDETDKLFELESKLAQIRAEAIIAGDSVAKARALVEANPLYMEMQKQRAKIKQVEEFIRISKLRARLTNDEIKNY